MLKIGLTGNIGSGKSVVCRIFEVLGIPVYYSDERAKDILELPGVHLELQNLFGNKIFDSSGRTDRKKIAEIVFKDSVKLLALNNIIHPRVIRDFENWVTLHSSASYVVLESALLFETGLNNLFDKNIVVSAPEDICIDRVMKRDNMSKEEIIRRIGNQMSQEVKTEKADFLIINDNEHLVTPQVLKIHQSLFNK